MVEVLRAETDRRKGEFPKNLNWDVTKETLGSKKKT